MQPKIDNATFLGRKRNQMQQNNKPPRMLTIREAAQVGPLTEYALRLLLKQDKLPGVFIGTKFLLNYDRFIAQLNGESLAHR